MENKIPSPADVALRLGPKTVQQRKGWHSTNVALLDEGDIVRMRLGGNSPSYIVVRLDNAIVHLTPYSTVGVGKVPPRTLDMTKTTRVWKWF